MPKHLFHARGHGTYDNRSALRSLGWRFDRDTDGPHWYYETDDPCDPNVIAVRDLEDVDVTLV